LVGFWIGFWTGILGLVGLLVNWTYWVNGLMGGWVVGILLFLPGWPGLWETIPANSLTTIFLTSLFNFRIFFQAKQNPRT